MTKREQKAIAEYIRNNAEMIRTAKQDYRKTADFFGDLMDDMRSCGVIKNRYGATDCVISALFENGIISSRLNVSKGNVKMGDIPSVSLPPVVTCNHNAPCFKECYARRMTRYPNVKNAWQENLDYYIDFADGYFYELSQSFKTSAYFRMHVGGDIPNFDYFYRLCETAKKAPNCQILIFTKQFNFVNDFMEICEKIPSNLHVIFSGWNGWKPINPYHLPETDIFTDFETLPKNPIVCGGNCTDCICRGCGCWKLKQGQTLYFKKH